MISDFLHHLSPTHIYWITDGNGLIPLSSAHRNDKRKSRIKDKRTDFLLLN